MAVMERWTMVSWTQVRVFITCSLALSVSTSPVNHANTAATCDFQSTELMKYPVGSSWEVRVGSQKDFQCINCTCSSNSLNVQCLPMPKKCPDLDKCIKIVDVPNSCCPVCAEVENTIPSSRKGSSRTDLSQPATPQRRVPARCHHNGQVYQEGQRWAPEANTTSVRRNSDNQCVQCDCHMGNTICYLRMCSPYTCKGVLVASPDSCCPICQEFVENDGGGISVVETDEPSGATDEEFEPYPELTNEEKPETAECISGPEKYEDGAQWNPIIPPFGRMKCVICECSRGNIHCRRPHCDREKLTCSKPVHKPGQCCPVCPEDSNEIANVSATGTFFCLRNTDYLVYENLHDGVVEIALRLPEEETISIHTWKMGKNSAEINSTTLKMWEFRRNSTVGEYKFLGTARFRRVQRFSRRINKIRQTCQSRCAKRVESLVQVLRIRSAQSGRKSLCPDKFRPVDTRL